MEPTTSAGHAEGWASFGLVVRLMRLWEQIAADAAGWQGSQQDWEARLAVRDLLTRVLAESDGSVRNRLEESLDRSDATFRAGTVSDEAPDVPTVAWWWHRVPGPAVTSG